MDYFRTAMNDRFGALLMSLIALLLAIIDPNPSSRNFDSSMEELTECLKSVQEWMDGVKLKLNPEKNEFIIIGQKAIRESLAPNFPVSLLQNNISPSVEVKNLGVIFDSDNSFDNHVAKVFRACYYHLCDLRRIRNFLGVETAILLANAMVSSRLDYCNSLLYGVSKSNIAKLQRVRRRGFAVAAPAEWNKLPQTVRSQQTIDGFRSQLKTYLFRLAYPHLSYTLAGAF